MTKKKFREMMLANEPRYLETMNSIEVELMIFLQLEVRNNIIIKNNQPLQYIDNRCIHFPKDVMNNRNATIPYDPINNVRFMQFLFNIYIQNYQIDNNISIQQFFLTPLDNEGFGGVVIRPNYSSQDLESAYYRNESLRYIDLILKTEGSFMYNESVFHELDEYLNFVKTEKSLLDGNENINVNAK